MTSDLKNSTCVKEEANIELYTEFKNSMDIRNHIGVKWPPISNKCVGKEANTSDFKHFKTRWYKRLKPTCIPILKYLGPLGAVVSLGGHIGGKLIRF